MQAKIFGIKYKRTNDAIAYDLKEVAKQIKHNGGILAIRLCVTDDISIDEYYWVAVDSAAEIGKVVDEYIENECFEQWDFAGGDLVDASGNIVGIYNPNKRTINPPDSSGNEFYQKLPDTSRTRRLSGINRIQINEWFL